MLPEKFDKTFAIKAICLTDKLNGTDKRVALVMVWVKRVGWFAYQAGALR